MQIVRTLNLNTIYISFISTEEYYNFDTEIQLRLPTFRATYPNHGRIIKENKFTGGKKTA